MSPVFKFLGFYGKKNIYNNLKLSKDLSIRFFILKRLIDERATSVILILLQLRLYSRFGFCVEFLQIKTLLLVIICDKWRSVMFNSGFV